MRVGHIICMMPGTTTGGLLYEWKLMDYLRRQGDHVDVFPIRWCSYGFNAVNGNLSRSLFRRLVETPLDVLIQQEVNPLIWLNRRLRHKVRYPIVSIVHHLRCSEARPAWQNKFYRWVERSYLSTVQAFIFNSEATRKEVESLRVGEQPSVLAFPGGDRFPNSMLEQEKIRARARQPGPLQILFVGNLIPRKGLHTLLAALPQLPEDSWRLEIVGSQQMDPRYVESIRRQIGQGRLENQVTLAGAVSDEELSEKLSQSHLLAVPSSYEGFGIVYLEGMGFGLPAIASTAGGAAEIVDHGRNGYLVSPGDVEALANYIYKLSWDRGLLERMSLAAQETYKGRPTWSEGAGRIRGFLESLIGEPYDATAKR